MKLKNIPLFIVLLVFAACSKNEPVSFSVGTSYYPIYVGKAVIYDVDSVVYNSLNKDTTSYQFQIKEQVRGVFLDNAGDSTYQIDIYKRSAPQSAWKISHTLPVNVRSYRVERVEQNQREIKLAFPVNASTRWNGNALNARSEAIYFYQDLHQPYLSFDSTVRVVQNERVSFVGDYHAFEIYAKDVGLIYKEFYNITRQTEEGQIIVPYVLEGYQFTLTYYGVE